MNCVAPGYIDTEMMRAVPADILERMIKGIPSQRLADPDEIASIVAFLSTEDSSWISGQTIFASGGAICQ
jgi:NAD(P)-dependent dehydrogenase (short-subunit alcohol dehydrogenase family)